jgi:Protein of unknown function (DUF1570)
MRAQPTIAVSSDRSIDRRSLLIGALAVSLRAACRAAESDQSTTDEDKERQAIEAIAATSGLPPFRTTRSQHYLGIGDANDAFRALTLQDCEAVAADYINYYTSQGFKVTMPAARLTVVILANERSSAAFSGSRGLQKSPPKVGPHLIVPGQYETRSNRLVVVDLHAVGTRRVGPWNLRVVAHEATHQLTFNTGLLNRQGDIPHAIGEGLAEYGAIRKSTGRTAPGQLHLESLRVLVNARRTDRPWYPVAQLLADDRPFLLDSFLPRQTLAYAQAWLLIDYLMKDRSRREGFRAYLDAIQPRTDSEYRLDDAEKHLGDLNQLDNQLTTYFVKLNKSVLGP